MPGIERVLQEGRYWYPVGSAARRLQTTASKVRELMGSGVLEWCQKGKSRTLLVSVDSTEAYRLAAPEPKRKAISKSLRSPDPLKRASADIPKLGDRSDDTVRTHSVFTPTWDPRSGREEQDG